MDVEVGAILDGKVTGITKFGAFVQLPGGASGLVHISEIASAYVNDVNDYLTLGDAVTVKVVGVNEQGKINLSIKQAQTPAFSRPSAAPRQGYGQPPRDGELIGPSGDPSFEDKLKHFMQEADSKISGNLYLCTQIRIK